MRYPCKPLRGWHCATRSSASNWYQVTGPSSDCWYFPTGSGLGLLRLEADSGAWAIAFPGKGCPGGWKEGKLNRNRQIKADVLMGGKEMKKKRGEGKRKEKAEIYFPPPQKLPPSFQEFPRPELLASGSYAGREETVGNLLAHAFHSFWLWKWKQVNCFPDPSSHLYFFSLY